jgi:hypothetical protein
MHLVKNVSRGYKLFALQELFRASYNFPRSIFGIITPGNRSFVIDKNNGTSLNVNFGKFTSIKALKQTISSISPNIYLFKFPAAVKIAFTALIPKS